MSMRHYCNDRRIDAGVRWLIRHGWIVKNTRKHVRLESDDGKRHLTVANSPSDTNAAKAFLRELRRMGIDLRGVI